MINFYFSIKYINSFLLNICKILVTFSIFSIVIVVLVGVFFRYILNDSLSWTEEVVRFLVVFLTFLGSPLALSDNNHAALDNWIYKLSIKYKLFMLLIINILIILFCLILIKLGIDYSLNAFIQKAPTLQISMFYIFISIPIGGTCMLLLTIEKIIDMIDEPNNQLNNQ